MDPKAYFFSIEDKNNIYSISFLYLIQRKAWEGSENMAGTLGGEAWHRDVLEERAICIACNRLLQE